MTYPTKKKFIKPLPIILGVIIAALIAIVIGWIFARADLIRFFLGNTRYAAAFAKGTVEAIADSGYAETALIYQLSHTLSTGKEQADKYEQYIKDHPDHKLSFEDYKNLLFRNNIFSVLRQFLPEKGIYIKTGIEAEPKEKLYKLAADTLHTDIGKIEKAFAALNHTKFEGSFSVKDNSAELEYLIAQDEKNLDSGSLYYNTNESSLYYLNPSVCDPALRTEIPALNTEDQDTDDPEAEKERKALIDDLASIYLKHLQNARTYYTDKTEPAGNGEFTGKSMSVTFENDVLIELFRDMTNAFYDSSYFNMLLNAAFDGTDPDSSDRISVNELKKAASKSLDDLKNSAEELTLTVEFFINTDNSFAGLSIRSISVISGESYSAQAKFINTETDIYAEVTENNNTYLKVQCEKTSPTSGTLNASINLPKNSKRDEAQNLDIAIIYSDLGSKKVFDRDLLLGVFNIDVSGSLLDELSLRSDAVDYGTLTRESDFTVSAKDSEKGVEYEIEVKNGSYGNATVTAELGENQKDDFDRTGMTLEEAVDLGQNGTKTLEAKTGALKHIKNLCSENGLLDVCFEYILEKNNINNIDKEIEKLENELKRN